MKTVYLHIGTPKTGTSHLQRFMSPNRAALLADGIYYLTDRQGLSAQGIALALGFWEEHDPHAYVESLEWFRAEMRRALVSTADIILLSTEMFCATPVNRRMRLLRRLRGELTALGIDRIDIVCYLRRQDLFLESAHANDIVNWGITSPVSDADFSHYPYVDYYKLLSDYRKVFGDTITVRTYERSQLKNGDILDDFFEVIGATRNPKYVAPKRDEANERVRGDLLEMLRLYHASGLGKRRDYSFFRWHFLPALFTGEQLGREVGARFRVLSPAKRAAILRRFGASNRKVAREFLGRKSGRLFLEPVVAGPREDRRGGLQIEEAVPLFMQMAAELFAREEPVPARLDKLGQQLTAAEQRCADLEAQSRAVQQECARLEAQRREMEWRLNSALSPGKKIIGWGTGAAFRMDYPQNPVPLAYLIDNDSTKWGKTLENIPVQHPGLLERERPGDVIVVVYSMAFDAICAQIAQMGHFTVVPGQVFARDAPRSVARRRAGRTTGSVARRRRTTTRHLQAVAVG
jgi:hypothetical protein